MPRITKVTIKGFQSHTDTEVELAPNLSVITGANDVGKTAIMRAIRWLAFNEPLGGDFVNKEVGETFVKLGLSNGISVSKRRRNSKTTYRVSSFPDPFIQADVPQAVEMALGIKKHSFGDFETPLNFAYQLEAPFLLSETASTGAKILGKLAGTEIIDLAIKALGKDTYDARQKKLQAEQEVTRINGDLVKYEGLDDLKEDLEVSELILKKINQTEDKLKELKELRKKHDKSKRILEDAYNKLDKLANVPKLEEDLKDVSKAVERYDQLINLYSKYNKLTETLNRLDKELKRYKDLSVATDIVKRLQEDSDQLSLIKRLNTLALKYRRQITTADKVLAQTEKVDKLIASLEEIEGKKKKLASLKTLKGSYSHYKGLVSQYQVKLDQLQDLTEANNVVNIIGEKVKQLQELKQLRNRYNNRNIKYDTAISLVEDKKQRVAKFKDQLENAWEAAGGKCPLCERPIE